MTTATTTVPTTLTITGYIMDDSVQVMFDMWEPGYWVWTGDHFEQHCYPYDGTGVVKVAITPEETAAALAQIREIASKQIEAKFRQDNQDANRRIERGVEVKVVRGRKVPVGTVARVFWSGETRFGWSCGLELTTGERVFTALKNLEALTANDPTDLTADQVASLKNRVDSASLSWCASRGRYCW